MRPYPETLGLTNSAFSILRDLIHERTGLFYADGKHDLLVDKLAPRVLECGFSSFLDYYYMLKYDPKADEEWPRVMDALSVQETYFWREIDQIRALVDIIVPAYFTGDPHKPLRIWSAACASGEEPLTIAMALNEAGWFKRAPIEIYASDASTAAIEKAQRGTYRERSFRNLPASLRSRYFTKTPKGWRVRSDLHKHIHWQVANLVSAQEVTELANAPVIFCRNAFIYFSEKAIRKTVRLFARHMLAPGYLFVGTAESLLRITNDFTLQEIGGAFVYVKRNFV